MSQPSRSEILEVSRSSAFVSYALRSDVQVKAVRSMMRDNLTASFAEVDERNVWNCPSDIFDRLLTFICSTDQQVHYAGEKATVGIYAFTKTLMEFRRLLMASVGARQVGRDSPIASPTGSPAGPASLSAAPVDSQVPPRATNEEMLHAAAALYQQSLRNVTRANAPPPHPSGDRPDVVEGQPADSQQEEIPRPESPPTRPLNFR